MNTSFYLIVIYWFSEFSPTKADLLAAACDTAMYAHLIKLGIWGIISIPVGAEIMRRGTGRPHWQQFGLQFIVWGVINAIIVLFALQNNHLPSAIEAANMREFLWFNEGLDAGYIGVGLTLVLLKRKTPSSPIAGAGLGVIIQGAMLLLLDTILIFKLPSAADWMK